MGQTVTVGVLRHSTAESKSDGKQASLDLELSLVVGCSEMSLDEVFMLKQNAESEMDPDYISNSSQIETVDQLSHQSVESPRFDDLDSSYSALYESDETRPQYSSDKVTL